MKKFALIFLAFLSSTPLQLKASDNPETSISSFENQLMGALENQAQVVGDYQRLKGLLSKNFNNAQEKQVLEAVLFVAEQTKGKKRELSSQEPYVCYPLEVAIDLIEVGQVKDAAVITVSLLQAIVTSEQDPLIAKVKKQFGSKAASVLQEVSRYPVSAKEKKQHRLMLHADKLSHEAMEVELADLLYSLKEITHNPPKKWSKAKRDYYVEWAQLFVERLPQHQTPLQQAVNEAIAHYWSYS